MTTSRVNEGDSPFIFSSPQSLDTHLNRALDEVIESFSEIFGVARTNLSFLKNKKFLQIVRDRAGGEENEIKSVLFASALNYLENPLAVYEGGSLVWGGEVNSLDIDTLKKYHITHILNVAGPFSGEFLKDTGLFVYKSIALEDNPQSILPIQESLDFIHKAMDSGGKVLVHCIEGKSRSGAIITAFFIEKYKLTYEKALAQVCKLRHAIPNEGFARQLRKFSQEQCSSFPV